MRVTVGTNSMHWIPAQESQLGKRRSRAHGTAAHKLEHHARHASSFFQTVLFTLCVRTYARPEDHLHMPAGNKEKRRESIRHMAFFVRPFGSTETIWLVQLQPNINVPF